MEPYEVYERYVAIKLHFTSNSYDFHKYNGHVKNANQANFEKRRDLPFFYKLSYKYKESEMTDFLVANLMEPGLITYAGELLSKEAERRYRGFLGRKMSLREVFKDDLTKLFSQVDEPIEALVIEDGQNPLILKEVYAGNCTLETLIIMNDILPLEYFAVLSTKLGEDILWPDTRQKAIKLRPFIKYSKPKMKKILAEFIKPLDKQE